MRKTSESSFLRSLRRYKIPRGIPSAEALIPGVGKLAIYVQFSTDIAVYLGKGAIYADDYDETVMGSHGCRNGAFHAPVLYQKG